MSVTYTTTIIGDGKHASIEIPDEVLQALGANRRAPLIVEINGHIYKSTATGVGGQCRVVFPQRERDASGVGAGDTVDVTLTLDSGYREVVLPPELEQALKAAKLRSAFDECTYSRRKEFARSVADAKAPATKQRRVEQVLSSLRSS